MTAPIDVARVEIQADTSGFPAEVNRGVSAGMKAASDAVDLAVKEMEAQFAELASEVRIAFDEVQVNSQNAFRDLATDGEVATTEIRDEFAIMGERIDQVFNEIQHSATVNFDQVEAKAIETGGVMKGAFASAAVGVGLVGSAVAGGLGLLTAFGLKSAANLEQVNIAFDSLTGSVAAGNAQFKALQQFAAATPFEFKDLTTASQRFDAFAASIGQTQQQLIPFLTTIGNLVSETGGGAQALDSISLALGQTASQGKITLGNLNQINNAIPGFSSVAALAAVRGESTAQVMQEISAGSINAKDGINQLLIGMQKFPGAAGAMDKQAQTLLGVFSTFQDTVSQALSNAFQPVIPAIKDTLTQITPIIGDALKTLAPALGGVLTSLLQIAGPLVTSLSAILTPLLNALKPAIAALGPAIAALGKPLGDVLGAVAPLVPLIATLASQFIVQLAPVLEELAPFLTTLAQSFAELAPNLAPVLDALAKSLASGLADTIAVATPLLQAMVVALNDILTAIQPLLPLLPAIVDAWIAWNVALAAQTLILDANPFGLIVLGIAALVVAVVELVKHWGAVVDAFQTLWGWIEKYANVITIFAPFVGLPIEIIKHWSGIASFFVGVWNGILDFFQQLPGRIVGFLVGLPQMLQNLATDAFHAFFFAVGFGIGLVIKEFIDFPKQVIFLITNMWKGLVDLFTQAIPKLIGFVVNLDTRIVTTIYHLWTSAVDATISGIANMVKWIAGLPGRALAEIRKLPGQVKTAVVDAAKWLYQAGKDVVTGLIHGIEDSVGSAIHAVQSAMGDVVHGALSALGINSPSKVFMEIGHSTVEGYTKGVDDHAHMALNSVTSMVTPPPGIAGGGAGGGVTFGPGAIMIAFNGVVPTQQEAMATGQAVGNGIAQRLATRNVNSTVRAL